MGTKRKKEGRYFLWQKCDLLLYNIESPVGVSVMQLSLVDFFCQNVKTEVEIGFVEL